MATSDTIPSRRSPGIARRLFLDHPRSLGMSWTGHGIGALRIGAALIVAGSACLVHAIIPGWFTETAGRTVTGMYGHMQRRKAAAPVPDQWPDYEI